MAYRVGIIGCGGMGHIHARSWNQRKDVDVVAAMDVSEEAARRLSKEYRVPSIYTDYEEMLVKEELEIVSIATWQGVRAKPTIAAAKAGVRAILGEKPIADNLGNADDMISACEERGVKIAIGHQRRFSPQANEIRRLVASGKVGEPCAVHHIAKPNAGLLNIGTHNIDIWRYYLGDPETLWVTSVRSGEIPGNHVIGLEGPDDRLEIRHEARGREGFARGALQAAEWVRGRVGVFTLDDMIRDRLGSPGEGRGSAGVPDGS